MEARQLERGWLSRALEGAGTLVFLGSLLCVLGLVITRRHELAQRAQQGLLPIWPLAPLLLGCACFLTAKLSRWRRRRLIAVGAAGLSPGFAALYLVGYLLMGLGTWLMLGW